MKKDDDRNWSAYIDGELSVSEVEEFESSLNPEQLEHLKNERKMEEGIGDKLKDAPCCTVNILDCIKERPVSRKFNKGVAAIIAFAAAACLVLFFALPGSEKDSTLIPQTVAELKKVSQTGSSLDDINSFLASKNIQLELTAFVPEHHRKEIIGAGIEMIAGEEVVTLMFTCCGRPAKVYILLKGSKADNMIAKDDKNIQARCKRGNYRLAVASPHNSESLLPYINHT